VPKTALVSLDNWRNSASVFHMLSGKRQAGQFIGLSARQQLAWVVSPLKIRFQEVIHIVEHAVWWGCS